MLKGQLKYTIEDMQKLAKTRGYSCVSTKYLGINTKLQWKCGEGHIFETTPHSFRVGTRCPICSRFESIGERITRKHFEIFFDDKFKKSKPKWLKNERGNLMELDGYNKQLKLAFEYQGSQHYNYIHFFHKNRSLEKRRVDDKLKKQTCRGKEITLIEVPYIVPFSEIGSFILKKFKEFGIRIPNPLKDIDYRNFLYSNAEKLAEMQQVAELKGGQCLSKKYITARSSYLWSCEKGHNWKTNYDNVKRGYWCKKCADEKTAKSKMCKIEEIRKMAKDKGFVFLSNTYLGARKKHEWRCKKGHKFSSTPDNIKRGRGCPFCVGKRKTIEDLKKAAKKKGGKCLSDEYKGVKAKYEWECILGHRWKAIGESILRGTWCPFCFRRKKKESKPKNLKIKTSLYF